MSAFIDAHRHRFGVEPICRVLGVLASACYQRATGARSARAIADERVLEQIREVHAANYEAYGYRRTWKALIRAGETVPRCQAQRLMRANGIRGAKRRGRPWRTTITDREAHRRADLVQRNFTAPAPDRLWVGDFTYLRCWQGTVFFAFVIDVYSRRVVGWQLAGHMRTDLVLDALRMALGTRRVGADFRLVAHTDRGSQGGFNWSSQRSMRRVVMGRPTGWMKELTGRDPMRSPGRPGVAARDDRVVFWLAIADGFTATEAAELARVSEAVGVRWFRDGGDRPTDHPPFSPARGGRERPEELHRFADALRARRLS